MQQSALSLHKKKSPRGRPFVGRENNDFSIGSNFVAPFFTDFCGGAETGATPSNCDKTWTFNYVIPAGETITAASLYPAAATYLLITASQVPLL